MLQFDVYGEGGAPIKDIDLSGAYLFGQDSIPLRADLAVAPGQITCLKQVPGAAGLALLWSAGQAGRFLLPTCRVPEREKPYNLNVELARAQTMRLAQKREDWGLFDYADATAINKEFDSVRAKFTEALKAADDPKAAAAAADEALVAGLLLGEQIALYHAEVFVNRRRAASGAAMRTTFGCTAALEGAVETFQERLGETFDFVNVPTPWKVMEPKEKLYEYGAVDGWVTWASKNRKFVHAGPLLSFESSQIPEWMYLWENDYDTLRGMIYEHVQQTVKRYERTVQYWKVVSGLHAFNDFNLTFDQIIELTRMTCQAVKKIAPRSKVIIELVMPWSEYYARNPKTIPPLLYADMAVQSGIKFDGFGVQVCMGIPLDGYYVRDLMQISAMLDEFVGFAKPLHVTACQVPAGVAADPADAWFGRIEVSRAGQWHVPWSPRLQAEWLQAFYRVAISKPFVESICWRDLSDAPGHYLPHGGLCDAKLEPKLAYKELRNFKNWLLAGRTAATPPPAAGPTHAPKRQSTDAEEA